MRNDPDSCGNFLRAYGSLITYSKSFKDTLVKEKCNQIIRGLSGITSHIEELTTQNKSVLKLKDEIPKAVVFLRPFK
jgi:hypothetical protein